MGIFRRKKKNKDYVDLTKASSSKSEGGKTKKPPVEPKDEVLDLTKSSGQEKTTSESPSYSKKSSQETTGFFGGFFSGNTQSPQQSSTTTSSENDRENSKKLSRMTEKIEDLSNQIYRLQQRVEVLERKLQTDRRL